MRQASGELDGVYQESLHAAQLTQILPKAEIMQAKTASAQYESLLDSKEVQEAFGKKEGSSASSSNGTQEPI